MLRTFCLTAALAASLVPSGLAQSRSQGFGRSADDWCDDGGNDRRARHCEVREETVVRPASLDVDAGRNGGIRVRGWDGADVIVRTKIVAYARTDADARRLASDVRIETAGGRVRADGPEPDRDENWSTSFEIQVPRAMHITLNARNGGLSIEDFRGSAQFRSQNGGVTLSNVGGDIRGGTTNGGVTIDLTGDRWEGAGLDVETQNGGVRIRIPERYSAELETGTTNGHVSIDFPITVQGVIGRRLTTTLGRGGARVRAMTTNGGVTISR